MVTEKKGGKEKEKECGDREEEYRHDYGSVAILFFFDSVTQK